MYEKDFLIQAVDDYKTVYSRRSALKKNGYTYSQSKKCWSKKIYKHQIGRERRFLLRAGLKGRVYSLENMRGPHYRQDYFKTHAPDRRGYYQCVYCGRKLIRHDVTVDHMIPIHRAATSFWIRLLLTLFGMENVNDPKNLVASCRACNTKKGSKLGLWLVFGCLGRWRFFWNVVYAALLATALVLAVLFIKSPYAQLTVTYARTLANLFAGSP